MRIVINRISNRISGAEIYNLYLLKSLQRYKDLEIIFSSDNKELNDKIKKLGFTVRQINSGVNEIGTKRQFLYSCLKLPFYFWKYIQFFSTISFDVIVFESMTEKIFLTPILKLCQKKVIWIEHGPLFVTQRATIIKYLYRVESKFVNKIICVSKSTKEDLVNNGISKNKTIELYIGIDTKEFAPMDQKIKFKFKSKLRINEKNVIGFLGTVTKEKGVIDFIEVASLIAKKRKDVHFVIIGEGDLLKWMKDEVTRQGISNLFQFTGFVKNVKDYLGIMDVLLFPSHHQEGLSIALLEASSMGVPIVATNIGGNREIVEENVNGILYRDSSLRNIKDIIFNVLSNKKLFKVQARTIALDKFSMDINGKKFYELFKSTYEK